jgi:bifunctional enzyme CysN/CysC/sulfate adenylyltransferase subunit 1
MPEVDLLRFVVVGSVDDGKSTLIGRLLYEANGLYDDHISQVKRATKQVGHEEIDFSLFTDGLRAEREQGITIDVAYRSFATPRRRFIVADTPGHVQYTRNMATGASTAEVALILIDARLRVLPQSRRHAYLASMLGIRHLVVAINKMDLVGYARETFDAIRAEFEPFVSQLGFEGVSYFPISARAGDNVVAASAQTPWHTGGTLLELLETVPVGRSRATGPLRFPVQYVLRPDLTYRGFAGQLASGSVSVGDEVVVLPSGRTTKIAGIDTFDGPLQTAFSPMSVTLRLADEVDVSRGDLIAHPADVPQVTQSLEANVVWLNERPLDLARDYLLKHTTKIVPAKLERLHSRLDLETLKPVPADNLGLNDVGRVTLRCLRPLCVDAYSKVRETGAFILIDALTNNTVCAGMAEAATSQPRTAGGSRVSTADRAKRIGHPGAIVCVQGGLDRAYVLEHELFTAGLLVAVVPTAQAAIACATAGVVAICAGDRKVRAELELSGLKVLEIDAATSTDEVRRALLPG